MVRLDRKLLIVSDGSTWGVAYSELSHMEVLKVAEQMVKALNEGVKVFENPDLVVSPLKPPAGARGESETE